MLEETPALPSFGRKGGVQTIEGLFGVLFGKGQEVELQKPRERNGRAGGGRDGHGDGGGRGGRGGRGGGRRGVAHNGGRGGRGGGGSWRWQWW